MSKPSVPSGRVKGRHYPVVSRSQMALRLKSLRSRSGKRDYNRIYAHDMERLLAALARRRGPAH